MVVLMPVSVVVIMVVPVVLEEMGLEGYVWAPPASVAPVLVSISVGHGLILRRLCSGVRVARSTVFALLNIQEVQE